MRSLFACLIALVMTAIFCPVPSAHAMSVGAPARTSDTSEFTLSGSIGYSTLDVRDEEVTSKSFLIKGVVDTDGRIMPYVKLGFADLEAGGIKGSLDFAYGVGVLLNLVGQESETGFRLSLDAQGGWSQSSEAGDNLKFFESQLTLIASGRTGGTTAYAGFAASFLNLDGGGLNENENGQGHLLFGVDYFMDYNFYFNAEAHLFGQNMLNIGVGYQF
ncbi:MAG: hypothetical protein RRA15_01790 [bacterium]|nr:hypothetical protein [bacterium]MDT8365212.1 hypothetical protein [bacterium]